MSLFGFDALGRLAFGQLPQKGLALAAVAGSYALTGSATTFTITEAPAAGSFALSGVSGSFTVAESAGAGAVAYTGVAASFALSEPASAGTFTINGQPANEIILEVDGSAPFLLSTFPANLVRTGDNYDAQQGGVGHFKWELERARQLAAITKRDPPGFVDLRSPVRFDPIGGPPIAPAAPAPDLSAIAEQQASAQMQATQVAKKRRRDIEALLLLAA